MRVTPFTKPDRFIACPKCGKGAFTIGHLPPGTSTAWYCHEDDCGYRFQLEVLENGDIETTVMDERCLPVAITLRSDGPVTIVIKGMEFQKAGQAQSNEDNRRYFYEEHTCPTNFLGVEQVIDESGDEDPHGLFKYVKTDPWRDLD